MFAENRVVIVAAGIGTLGPRAVSDARIASARCYGGIVTLEPTGVVLVRRGLRLTLAQLFRSWGQALSPTQLVSFPSHAGTHVAVFVDGRRVAGSPGACSSPATRRSCSRSGRRAAPPLVHVPTGDLGVRTERRRHADAGGLASVGGPTLRYRRARVQDASGPRKGPQAHL